jgi:hypothetical protein
VIDIYKMRPAISATKKKQFANMAAQTERAYRTSVWVLRNIEDKHKSDAKVVLEHLKDAYDEIERMRDQVDITWSTDGAKSPVAKPVDKAKIEAMTQLMPGVAPADAARVILILGEILGAH